MNDELNRYRIFVDGTVEIRGVTGEIIVTATSEEEAHEIASSGECDASTWIDNEGRMYQDHEVVHKDFQLATVQPVEFIEGRMSAFQSWENDDPLDEENE